MAVGVFQRNSFRVVDYNSYKNIMADQLKKQDLLKLIDQIQIIQKLPRQSLEELCKIFRLGEHTSDIPALSRLLKDKICDIICQQGETYMDYLQLPKFRSLKSEIASLMFNLFKTVWEQYAEFTKRSKLKAINKQIDQMIPVFQSSADAEQFHLNLLHMYRGSSIYPKRQNEFLKSSEAKPAASTNYFLYSNQSCNNSLNPNIVTPIASTIYPYSYFPHPTNYLKLQNSEAAPYILQNKPTSNLMLQERQQIPQSTPVFYTYPQPSEQGLDQKRRQESKPDQNRFELPFDLAIQHFANYEYIQCACEGKKGAEIKGCFKCIDCSYKYHGSCLSIDLKWDRTCLCPLCILRKQSMLCKLISNPIKFNWYTRKNKGLKIQMTMEQTNSIHEFRKKGYSCQIRFLKIQSRELHKDDYSEQQSNHQKYLQRTKHTQILLPQLPEDKNNPISLQILLRPNQPEDKTKLYFFAVFLINFRQVDDILAELFSSTNYVTQNYYDEWRDAEGTVQVKLNVSKSKSLIHYPVRGANCRHAEVFDFKSFLQGLGAVNKASNYQIACPVCSAPCAAYNYDETLYKCISKYEEYEEKRPSAIKLQKSGEHVWLFEREDSCSDAQNQAAEEQDQAVCIQYESFENSQRNGE